jgi:hypothetical protein
VSNWAGFALAGALATLAGKAELCGTWTEADEQQLIAALVAAGAVDGVTARREVSVDGLSWSAYYEPLRDLSRAFCAAR